MTMSTGGPTGGSVAGGTDGPRGLIPDAAAEFGRLVHAVPSDRWDAPTPCSEWTVRDLVNHLVSEHLWAPHLLRGETMEQVGDRYDGDVVGDDPARAWDTAQQESVAAFTATPDDRVSHLSFGDAPVCEYAEQMLTDLVVHSWDLARGAGLDAQIPPSAVDHVRAFARSQLVAPGGIPGIFAPPVETDSADPLDQLVAQLGRQP